MPRALHLPNLIGRLQRPVAAACALMVFALGIFAASPVAHEWLHADQHRACSDHPRDLPAAPAEADTCAVVLFAGGVSLPVAPLAVLPPTEALGAVSPVPASSISLRSPRYLRQPERGPPARLG